MQRRWGGLVVVSALAFGGCKEPPRVDLALAPLWSNANAEAPLTAPRAKLTSIANVERADQSSVMVVARVEGTERAMAYIADADEHAIVAIDVGTRAVIGRTMLDSRPGELLLTPEGTLLVTEPDAAAVEELTASADPREALIRNRLFRTKREPRRMAWNAAKGEVFVTSGLGRHLQSFDFGTGEETRSLPLGNEPRAIVIAEGFAFVSYAAEGRVDKIALEGDDAPRALSLDNDLTTTNIARHVHAMVRVEDQISFAVVHEDTTGSMLTAVPPPPRTTTQIVFNDGFPDDDFSFAGSQGYGGGSGPAVSDHFMSVDIKNSSVFQSPIPLPSCRLPTHAIATKQDLVVACRGESAIVRRDVRKGAATPNSIVRVPAGPVALATLDESRVLVWSSEARVVSVVLGNAVELNVDVPRTNLASATWLRGRELFYATDNTKSSGDGRACATCHIEGRDDNNVWSTPNGERRPLVLAGMGKRDGGFGWRGEHATFAIHVRETSKRLGGTGLPADDLAALETYVRDLETPPEAPLSPEEAQGKKVFFAENAGCGDCHHETSGWSDAKNHDVGIGMTKTPSVVGVGGRARFGHDGRYASLEGFLGETKMGHYKNLDPADRAAITAFLRTM